MIRIVMRQGFECGQARRKTLIEMSKGSPFQNCFLLFVGLATMNLALIAW